jgi:hypothetical protein
MSVRKLFAFGSGGLAAFGILCCVSPLLPIVLGGLGASWLLPVLYRDAVLLPFSALMLVISGALFWSMRR